MSAHLASPQTQAIVQWFESLTPQTLASIDRVYAPLAQFRDPFNNVCGVEAVRRVYAHMFENLQGPRFEVTEVIEQGSRVFMAWRFLFVWRGRGFEVDGASRFLLNGDGQIVSHVDYWDVAAGIYEKLPWLGGLLRGLRRRMRA